MAFGGVVGVCSFNTTRNYADKVVQCFLTGIKFFLSPVYYLVGSFYDIYLIF